MRLAAALVMLSLPAHAADDVYCVAYARGAATMALGQMSPADRAAVTYPTLATLLGRLEASCWLAEESADQSDPVWTAGMLDEIKRPAAVAAAAATPPAEPSPQAGAVAGHPPPAVISPGRAAALAPAQVCAAAKRRIVWSGKSWRCA